MKILAIGNSFSRNATTYLHQTAAAQGISLTAVNLYIGGCSLETHRRHWSTGEAAYELDINGETTGKTVSARDVMAQGGWDAVVTQQASHDSGWMDTYEPFLTELTDAWRKAAPGARLLLHETWAYEKGSDHAAFPRYHCDQKEMYDRLRICYGTMAAKHGMEMIPCGDVIQRVRQLPPFRVESGGISLCSDGYHMTPDYGMALLSFVWLRALCGADVRNNPFIPDRGGKTDPELMRLIREEANR